MDKAIASEPRDTPFRRADFWAAAALGAALSMVVSGYAFPFNNNVYHLPILAELYKEPEFASDAFIQSLRHFASGVWMGLAGSARWIEPKALFFILLCLSRVLSFVGFLACADHFGLRAARQRYLFAALIAVIGLLQTASYAGEGGLFVNYFTHSEIANGLFLLAVYAVLRGRFDVALAMIGPVFFVNAFFGVWLAFVMAFALANEVVSGRLALRRLIGAVAIGAVVGAIFALPVVLNVASNPQFGRKPDFDHVAYLEFFYPHHFLAHTLPLKRFAALAFVVGICALSLARLADPMRRMAAILVGCVALYGVGVVLPLATRAPLALNLHLLRSGTLIHLSAALLLGVVVVRWWFGAARARAALAAALLATSAFHPGRYMQYLGPAALFALLIFERFADRLAPARRLREALGQRRDVVRRAGAAVAVIAAGAGVYVNWSRVIENDAWQAEWAEVARWARRDTAPGSQFLAPTFRVTEPHPGREEEIEGAAASTAFEYLSHRSIWADMKRGAAVMWQPSYHATWAPRVREALALESFQQKQDYARGHGVSYIVEITRKACQGRVVFRTRRLCVSATG